MDLSRDVVSLTSELIGTPSESRHEQVLADAVEAALAALPHLTVERIGNSVIARTQRGRGERVIIAGHLDTVPSSGNDIATLVPAGAAAPVADASGSRDVGEDRLYGLGACDMKGGVAVALRLAHDVIEPTRDVTFLFYECEEIEASANGLQRIADIRPELLAADFAILMEPSNAMVEAGCQGTLRVEVTTRGRRAHTARAWMGANAIHAAGEILRRLEAYAPRRPIIDGLQYHEGLQAVAMRGGVAGNVVPDSACVTVNHRFAPDRTAAEAEAHVRAVFDGFEVTVVDSAAGALPGLGRPAAAAFVRAVGGDVRPKFGWTDVARFSALGVPAVNFGPADPALAHTPHEYVPVAQLHHVLECMRTWLTT